MRPKKIGTHAKCVINYFIKTSGMIDISNGIKNFYRSGTVNSKLFIGKVFLRNKWNSN